MVKKLMYFQARIFTHNLRKDLTLDLNRLIQASRGPQTTIKLICSISSFSVDAWLSTACSARVY